MTKSIIFLSSIILLFSSTEIEIKRFTLIEVLSYFLFVYIFIDLHLSPIRLKRFMSNLNKSKWLFLYLLWSFICAILFWVTPEYQIQLDFKRILPGAIFYIATLIYVNEEKDILLFIKIWVLAGLFNAALGFSQFFYGGPHPVSPSDIALEKLNLSGETSDVLVTGLFVHPNGFSQVILPYFVFFTIIFIVSITFYSHKILLYLLLAIIFGAVLVFTDTKGAMLWSFAGVGTGMIHYRFSLARRIGLYWMSWFTMVIIIFMLALVFVNYLEISALRTMFSRFEFIITAFNIFIDHPFKFLVGGSLSYWEKYCAEFATWQFVNAHNVYINQILMYGAIGAFFLIMFINSVIKMGINIKDNNLYISASVGSIFAVTGSYFFEPSFSYSTIKFQLLFLLTLISWFTNFNCQLSDSQMT